MTPAVIKPKTCACCGTSFTPKRPLARACSVPCAMTIGRAKTAAKAAKAEKAQDKVRREAAAPRKELVAAAQKAFNLFIRTRDAHQPCICCGKPFEPGKLGGSVDAGHYLSRGSAPHLRFTEDNCFAQRKNCNRPGGTSRTAFRMGVIARIGIGRVEAVETDQTPRKWTLDELREIRAIYSAKTKQLKKEQE